jgi:hypothetical protein
MSDIDQSEAQAQSAFAQQIDISERFADLAAEDDARWEAEAEAAREARKRARAARARKGTSASA